MSSCTAFCNALRTLQQTQELPTRDDVLDRLPVADGDGGWCLGMWHDLQQRTQCRFCELVTIAVSECVTAEKLGSIDEHQDISVYLFPEEVSFRLSFPSQLGTRLAFVANDASQASGPDVARISGTDGINIARLKSWLETCSKEHDTCKAFEAVVEESEPVVS